MECIIAGLQRVIIQKVSRFFVQVQTKYFIVMKKLIFGIFLLLVLQGSAQKILPFQLNDTGQMASYTSTSGEDADFILYPMSFTDNLDGTITDNNTGLMWQKTDGSEMTFENANDYCQNLSLGGYSDWRLPTGIELFSLNHFDQINPALDLNYFPKTVAEYWWTSEVRVDDATKIWVVNAGGGIGAHPKLETVSAGGIKNIHVRAVRNALSSTFSVSHFFDNGNGTITDNFTGLIWQKIQSTNLMTWEEALSYCKTLNLANKTDWRLPNIKELQSLNDPSLSKPSFNKTYFPNINSGNYWSSTSLYMTPSKSWDLNVDYGIVSQSNKTIQENVILVRGGLDNNNLNLNEALIPGGEFEMGDHFGFVDPSHPSDELPVHQVKVNSFYCSKTETTNQQYLAFLNALLLKGSIEVKNNMVYLAGTTEVLCYTHQYAVYYSISYDGKAFSMADFRGNHPMVGVMWGGAAAFCNWLSLQNGLQECYNLKTWACNFTQNGYRLPTEAEWEFAGRGGNLNPYLNYPSGNNLDQKAANLPNSGDPYEIAGESNYPLTTPVAFYEGQLHLKSEFNWPGAAASYQTNNGANGYGLYDMQGNVWEFINDWYGQNYYSTSPYDNPKGPDTGFLMPDGKAYRGMRGGNWYNGLNVNGISDGHSRVSNRNPSYYRGPQDPNHPYYHLGFRVVRNYTENPTSINSIPEVNSDGTKLLQNFPNPFSQSTSIRFSISKPTLVSLKIFNSQGRLVTTLVNSRLPDGMHELSWNAGKSPSGVFSMVLQTEKQVLTRKMILIK
jgi:formylglycine-generating enzyme required for sulfatase activity